MGVTAGLNFTMLLVLCARFENQSSWGTMVCQNPCVNPTNPRPGTCISIMGWVGAAT
jgi:hypothetical protein